MNVLVPLNAGTFFDVGTTLSDARESLRKSVAACQPRQQHPDGRKVGFKMNWKPTFDHVHTVLQLAVGENNPDVVRYLLKRGADPNQTAVGTQCLSQLV